MPTLNLPEIVLQPQFDSSERVALRKLAQAVLDDVTDNYLVTRLDELSDVDAILPDNGDILRFRTSSGKWEAETLPNPGGGGDGGLFPIVPNNDVSSIDAELDWNETAQYFINEGGFVLVTILPQESLEWEDNSSFEVIQGTDFPVYVEAGDDVTILTGPPGNEIRTFNPGDRITFRRLSENIWVAWELLSIKYLDDLFDVDASEPMQGNTILYNTDTSAWEKGAAGLVVSSVTGVTASSFTNGKYLRVTGVSPTIAFLDGSVVRTGTYFEVEQNTDTQLTFSGSGTVTFVKLTGFDNACVGRYGVLKFRHMGSHVWHVSGDLDPS